MADQSFLSWPFLDDAHRELARDVAAWADNQFGTSGFDDHGDVDQDCRNIRAALGDAGWTRYSVPAAYGGARDTLDVRSLCLLRETLAYRSGLADFVFAMQGLGSGAISLAGSEAQKQQYLPGVASGSLCAAFALTEPEAGSDVAAIATTATDDGDQVVINGEKTFISNGGIADFYVVFARTGEAEGARGLSAFIVDADTPGLKIAERIDTIAPHPLARLEFDDCRVPKTQRIGDGGVRFQNRHVDPGRVQIHRRGGLSWFCPAGLGRSDRPRQYPRALWRAARQPAGCSDAIGRDGAWNRCLGTADLPSGLGKGPRRAAHYA